MTLHISIWIQNDFCSACKKGGLNEFVLCCLMTHGLGKDIRCHVHPYSFLWLQVTRSDIRPHVKWTVRLLTADSPLISLRGLCGYLWVNRLTLSPLRVVALNVILWCCEWCCLTHFSYIYCGVGSLKPLWSGMWRGVGGSSASLYLANPTSPIPSHCAIIIPFKSVVMTSILRVKWIIHTPCTNSYKL